MRKLLTILSLSLLVSCQDYNAGINKADIIKGTYQAEFVQEFGKPDSRHDWGFISTRATMDPNSNEWYVTPDPITDTERNVVSEWFSHPHSVEESITLDWSDYFVQHVYTGDNAYKLYDNNHAEHTSNCKDHMDHLQVGTDHINNFNSTEGEAMLVYDSNTNVFRYHDSFGDGTDGYHDKYIIHYFPGYGYYLGFDYQTISTSKQMTYNGDDIYNDWIIKIIPGEFKEGIAHRVFAEDLGSIGDWDFNDVVFDYYIDSSGNGIIKLLAAGGTLPIYIGALDKEVHDLFKVPVNTPVNVNAGTTCPPVIWRFTGSSEETCYDVILRVDNTIQHTSYEIEAIKGQAPGKICVPTTVAWTKENQNIKDKYPNFDNWVSNQNNHFWK